MSDDETLGETGQILVTQAAAREYGAARGLRDEEARRELLVLLGGARRAATQPRSGVEGWRIRSRAARVDVSAHVSREGGGLAVVVHVHVRDYRQRAKRQ